MDIHTLDQDFGYRSEVVKGHRFAISCSTGSLYKPFSMRLRYEVDSDQAVEWIQPTVGKTAMFFFPAAEDAHQGYYNCDYNYEFKPDFFSKQQLLYVTVTGKSELITSSQVSSSLSIQSLTFYLNFLVVTLTPPTITLTLTQYLLSIVVLYT